MLEFAPRNNWRRGALSSVRLGRLQRAPLHVPLSRSLQPREPVHTRSVRFDAYRRADALWDLEAHLTDTRTFDTHLESGVRPAGAPVHDMWLRLTVDEELNVLDAEASTDSMPYPGFCQTITPEYRKLIGLNLLRGFRLRTTELFGRIQGCTHLTEMLAHFPTAAVQAMFRKTRDDGVKPFQLDRCHALRTDAEAVRRYYPRWFRDGSADSDRTDKPEP